VQLQKNVQLKMALNEDSQHKIIDEWYFEFMKETLQNFLSYLLHEKSLKPNSAEAYIRHITYLYLEADGDILKACKKYSDVADLIRRVKLKRAGKYREIWTDNMAAKTAYMATVFFTWAAREGIIEANPMQFGHEFKKGKSKLPEWFDPDSEDLKKLYSYPHNTLQDLVIYKLFYASGLRRSELCALNIIDINTENRTGLVYEGKNGEARPFFFDDETAELLKKHIEGMKLHYPSNKALFLNEKGIRLDPHALTKDMLRRGLKIGIKMNPHKFRHSVGGRIIENGGDIKLVADILGHKSLSSTNIYTHFSKKKTSELYDKFNKPTVKIESPSAIIA